MSKSLQKIQNIEEDNGIYIKKRIKGNEKRNYRPLIFLGKSVKNYLEIYCICKYYWAFMKKRKIY